MKRRFSIPRAVYVLSLLLVSVLSLGTSWMLFKLNKDLVASRSFFADNIPSYSLRAEYELARLVSALNKLSLGSVNSQEIQLRYDILLARLSHYEAAFNAESRVDSPEVSSRIASLLDTMLQYEERFFALQNSDKAALADMEELFENMHQALEELTTLTQHHYHMNLNVLDERLARGIRLGFLMILSTVIIGAMTLALLWFNLREKRRFNADLEARILRRTKDLQISNANLKIEIAERQRAEKSLSEREQQMHRVQKMEAVGKVTTGVAHDFNNLLAVIMGNVELLKSSDDAALSAKYIDSALSAANMGSQLTRKLLAFGRRSPLKPEVVDINQIIVEIDDMLVHSLPENISLNLELCDAIWSISVDRSLLENVMLNLVINARDALVGGGCIVIETRNAPSRKGSLQSSQTDSVSSDCVCVSITDGGSGMTPQVLDQAFDPFFSTKSESKGSGLGLSMASGFVQQSDGEIKISSTPGQGTTVQLLFPRSFLQGNTLQREDNRHFRTANAGRTILVVEDSEAVRQVVVEQLHALGYQTLEAANGSDGFALVKTKESIDLMLSDVVMPGTMQGLELAEHARVIRPDLKIIIMSGYPRSAQFQEAECSPAFTKLMKPVSFSELSQALEEEFTNDSDERLKPAETSLDKA